MKIRIKKQHLKNAEFCDNFDCPLARALKNLGYKKVYVTGIDATGHKNRKQFAFRIPDEFTRAVFDAISTAAPFTTVLKRIPEPILFPEGSGRKQSKL
jgi:hypothetical protein